MSTVSFTHTQAIDLLTGLVSIPSLSTQEQAASTWLVEQMRALGFRRAYVDEVHNAVGEVGPVDAARTRILLGHIDTVPGAIPVRVEGTGDDAVLYGRGTVDAKGPLATFVSAAARVGDAWAAAHDVRIIVVGAVEEEAATSRGARHIRARFDGAAEPIPDACLVTTGPYRWIRHPMYASLLLFMLGVALYRHAWPNYLGLVLLGIAVFGKMHREETHLHTRFEDYSDYVKRTHRLFPGIY